MHKRISFWFGVLSSLTALILLAFFFSVPGVLLVVLAALAGALLATTFRNPSQQTLGNQDEQRSTSSTSDQSFALARLFQATMDGMREGLLVVDRDMRVVSSNAAARRLFGASLGKLEAQRLTQLTRNPAIYGAFLDALQGKERSGVKVETFGDGRYVFDLRVVPLSRGGQEEPEGAIGVFFDVTRLEKLEKVRQEFLSNVSHELRTPLTAILAFVETLESGPIDDESTRRFLSIIRRNAARMHSLINDILELSAIESGTVQVQTKHIRLAPVINDVITSLASAARSRDITLTNQVNGDVVVAADLSRLEQMLTNLIENAIKFNREGGSVTVRYDELGARSRIMIEDTGEGIPAQHLERLFERFYRVDRARSRDLGGTGLGLAIVKHLARAHGGEVSVDSRLGEGSVFSIELPKPSGGLELLEKETESASR